MRKLVSFYDRAGGTWCLLTPLCPRGLTDCGDARFEFLAAVLINIQVLGILHRSDWCIGTDVSEVRAAFIFRVWQFSNT
jgi:hypothetical protein